MRACPVNVGPLKPGLDSGSRFLVKEVFGRATMEMINSG
jgi:hypothetical protein